MLLQIASSCFTNKTENKIKGKDNHEGDGFVFLYLEVVVV